VNAGDIQLIETLSASPRSVVVRGLDEAGRAVVIKRAAPMLAPAEGRSRLLHERTIYEHVASPRMLRLLEFVDQPDGAALVFEDPACGSLTRHAHAHPLSVLDSLRVTLGVLEALAILHRAHVVHRDVKPDNVLVDDTLSRMLLIDFGIASVVQRATGTTSTRGRLEGTVEFMAPELTGRVNLDVDYRSDYYCLGASLYWMLAGEPPFVGLGISELVHAHIARVPARLDERDPAIPGPVASIVAKLLAKSPDQRYQGAFGLRRDLERCIAALERGQQIEDFELAERDPSQQLQLAQRLYGRERERAVLDAAREQTRQTQTPQLVVIAGPAGCGKSRLVEDFRERLDRERLHFIEHRVEARPSEPMAVVKHTLSRLLRSYERSSDALLDEVHERLHDQLDETGAALAEVLPELEQILGRRPQLPPVDPGAARARLLASIGRFADALMLPGHEYVLFIDDLQWADEASLHLVEQLLDGPRSVLVLATLRDDGTSLAEVRARIQAMAGEHHTLELGPLDQVAVLEWAQELLGGAAEAPAFAELLSMRTGGTPMFIEQFVVALHDAGAIGIDHTSGRWTVDLERARGQASSGGVVEFLVGRLRELPARSLEVLGLAALIGPRFEGATLAALAGRDEAGVATALHEAIVAGFVSASHDEIGSTYEFAHERIRHAAAQSVVGDPARLHLRIARRMLEADPSASNPETLHAVVNHLGEVVGEAVGEAVELLRDPEERGRFADLCVRAATHARAAAAFAGAARHYDAATRLLDDDTCHEPLFEAQLGRAESLCMAGELERGVAAYVELAAIIRTRHERIRVLLSRELVHMFSEDLESCLQILVEAAGLFELDLRRGGSSQWVGGLMQQVLDTLATRTAASIIDGPRVSDPELEMLLALLLAATNPAYVCGDLNLMTALTLTIIALSLEHGCSDATATAFVQLALLSATALHDFEGARRWSQLGFALFEHFPTSVLRSGATMVHAGTVQPWIAPLGPHDPALREAFHQLRNAGMFTDAGYATNMVCLFELLLGAPLEDTLEDATATTTFHAGIGATVLAQVSASTARACRILLDAGATSAELVPHDSGGTGGAGKAEAFFCGLLPNGRLPVPHQRGVCGLDAAR
jgi:predicted ATPase